jgi:hypothetical protein
MNDNQTLTRDEREQLERFREHQEQFRHRRMMVGFCRWMKNRFAPATATVDKPRQPPVSLQAARTSKSRRRSSDASQDPAD